MDSSFADGSRDGESTDATWIQHEQQDDESSVQELESLDPHKREQLEARIMGRSFASSPESNQSGVYSDMSKPSGVTDKSSGTKKRRRLQSTGNESRPGSSKYSKIDSCRKINEFFGNHPVPHGIEARVQTDLTVSVLCELEKAAGNSKLVSSLEQCVAELEQRLSDCQEKLESTSSRLESTTSRLTRSVALSKELLIRECIQSQKKVKEESLQNQLRLGRFITQRQGARFVDVWEDGTGFTSLSARQDKVNSLREELERQRKSLSKRKPSSSLSSTPATTKQRKHQEDGFTRPTNPSLSSQEYMEKDEELKFRAAVLKREDANLCTELEKLERERNIHIRELKRLTAQDSSRFKNQPTLHQRYLLLNLIGKGGFSEVYKGFDLLEQNYVACKIHQLNSEWMESKKANYIKHALREYNIHKKLDHSNIVKLFDVFEIDSNSFCTVLEYIDGYDLDFLLKQNHSLAEKEVRAIIIHSMSALKYLNEIKPPVIHFDLKPGEGYKVKITDFGLSKVVEQESPDGMELTSQGAGTYWYLPPECFVIGKEPPKISSKVDVWSIGVIFFQCLYGKKPFGHNMSQASILEQNTILNAREVDFPSKPPVSLEAKNFIRRCLSYKKETRPDILALYQDAYLHSKRREPSSVVSLLTS